MMNAKILIVEDEPAIQELLAFNVMQAAFRRCVPKTRIAHGSRYAAICRI